MSTPVQSGNVSALVMDAFCQSLADTFSQMVFIPVTLEDPISKREGSPTGCLSGTIGLSGTYNDGETELRTALALIFRKELALRVFRSMMMMEDGMDVEITELRDVVGELTNMTAGGGKSRLAEHGFRLSLSLPTVVVGENHYLGDSSKEAVTQVVPVTIDEDQFHMEVSVV